MAGPNPRSRRKPSASPAAILQTDPEHVVAERGRFYTQDIPDRYVI